MVRPIVLHWYLNYISMNGAVPDEMALIFGHIDNQTEHREKL